MVFELVKLRVFRDEHLDADPRHETSSSRSAATQRQSEVNSTVVGWDDHERLHASGSATTRPSRSTSKSAAATTATSSSAASWSRSCTTIRRSSSRRTVAAGKRADLLFEIVRTQGHNAKQNNVTLETAEVKP